jgi:hypothetical protein
MTASLTLTASRFRLLRPALTIIWIHHHAVKLWAARFFVHGHHQRRNTVCMNRESAQAQRYITNMECELLSAAHARSPG